jgi:hypothetical protein
MPRIDHGEVLFNVERKSKKKRGALSEGNPDGAQANPGGNGTAFGLQSELLLCCEDTVFEFEVPRRSLRRYGVDMVTANAGSSNLTK